MERDHIHLHFGYRLPDTGSLKTKISRFFRATDDLFVPHNNPPAMITTTLKEYNDHTAVMVYEGDTFLRSHAPNKGDKITVSFKIPMHLKGVYIRTGNKEYPNALLKKATVEVLTVHEKPEIDRTINNGVNYDSNSEPESLEDYQRIATFDNKGVAYQELEDWHEKILEVIVRVLFDTYNELVVSEMLFETK